MNENTTECLVMTEAMREMGEWTSNVAVCTVFYVFYVIIFFFGMIGNSSIIYIVYLDGRSSRCYVTNVYLFNMAASGVLLCLFSVTITPIYNCEKRWIFGDHPFLCQFFPISQIMSVLVSSFSLMLIAVDRYRNIVRLGGPPWSGTRALILSGLCWSIAAIIALPGGLNMQIIKPPGICGTICTIALSETSTSELTNRVYGTLLFTVQFAMPMLSMAYCYTKIIIKVKEDMVVNNTELRTTALGGERRRRRVLITLCILVCSFALAWLPIALNNLLSDFGYRLIGPKHAIFTQQVCHLIGVSTVVWNPFLYYWINNTEKAFDSRVRNSRILVSGVSGQLLCAPGIQKQNRRRESNEKTTKIDYDSSIQNIQESEKGVFEKHCNKGLKKTKSQPHGMFRMFKRGSNNSNDSGFMGQELININ